MLAALAHSGYVAAISTEGTAKTFLNKRQILSCCFGVLHLKVEAFFSSDHCKMLKGGIASPLPASLSDHLLEDEAGFARHVAK